MFLVVTYVELGNSRWRWCCDSIRFRFATPPLFFLYKIYTQFFSSSTNFCSKSKFVLVKVFL